MWTSLFGNLPRMLTISATLILTLLIVPAIVAQSQITTGTIEATVVDVNGAAVTDADVEIKKVDTNFVRTLKSDDGGRFKAPLLQPGKYSVTVAKQGFGTTEAQVELTVGQTLTIPFSLAPAGVEGKVTVTTTPTVDTSKTQVSTTLNETAVSTTPILGRKF